MTVNESVPENNLEDLGLAVEKERRGGHYFGLSIGKAALTTIMTATGAKNEKT